MFASFFALDERSGRLWSGEYVHHQAVCRGAIAHCLGGGRQRTAVANGIAASALAKDKLTTEKKQPPQKTTL